MRHVNLYAKTQCYGGPEEGGWFYTALGPVECAGIYNDDDEAQAAADALRNEIEQPDVYHMGVNDMDGCDPDGISDDDYLMVGGAWGEAQLVVRIEDHLPQPYPQERPRYE